MNQLDSYVHYKQLVEEYDSIRPNYEAYMNLVRTIGGSKWEYNIPPLLEQKLKEVGGDEEEDVTGNRKKIRVSWDGKFAPRESVGDWSAECEIVSELVRKRKTIYDYYARCIDILREWKESCVVVVSGDVKNEIEALASGCHNKSLINEDHVTRVWDDGEIDSQKGGYLYGHRSVFTRESPVNVTGLAFPMSNGKYSYAIVTSKDAERIRNMIIAETTAQSA